MASIARIAFGRAVAVCIRATARQASQRVVAPVARHRVAVPWMSAARTYSTPAADVEATVIQIVKDFDKVESEVSSSTHFLNDLGLDSLDAVELIMAFEDKFEIEIPDDDTEKLVSVNAVVEYINARNSA